MRRFVNSQKQKISTCKNRHFFDLAHSNQTLTTNVSEYAVRFEVLFSPKCPDAFIIAVDIYHGFRFVKNNAKPGYYANQRTFFVLMIPFVV